MLSLQYILSFNNTTFEIIEVLYSSTVHICYSSIECSKIFSENVLGSDVAMMLLKINLVLYNFFPEILPEYLCCGI